MCVCVCVCVRERERETDDRETERDCFQGSKRTLVNFSSKSLPLPLETAVARKRQQGAVASLRPNHEVGGGGMRFHFLLWQRADSLRCFWPRVSIL